MVLFIYCSQLMNIKSLITWISIAGLLGVIFGIFYAFFGLHALPVYKIFVPDSIYTSWSNGLYGSVFIGFSVMLFFVGRHAFQHNNKALMKALLYGIMSWLIVELLFSFYYRVYINVGVDIALIIVLGFPLMIGIRSKNK